MQCRCIDSSIKSSTKLYLRFNSIRKKMLLKLHQFLEIYSPSTSDVFWLQAQKKVKYDITTLAI